MAHKHTRHKINKYITVSCPCCNGNRRIVNGQYLKMLRESVMMDQRTFGKPLSVSGPYISDIERNRRDCPEDVLNAYLQWEAKL